jgi:hypothetical protein
LEESWEAVMIYSGISACSCGDVNCNINTPVPTPTLYTGPEQLIQKEPTIISEIDGWQMEKADPMLIPWAYNTCSLLSHYCPKTGWRQYMVPDEVLNTGCCSECHLDIPDSVLAVWHLYNADEKSKYDKKLAEASKGDESLYEEPTGIWPDSRPIAELTLFADPEGNIYGPNGDLLNEEVGEWNGDDNVTLYSHDESLLHFDRLV